jgi:nitrile hydratase alpha subunit
MAKTVEKSEKPQTKEQNPNEPGYFERRATATTDLLVEHGVLTEEEARAVKHGHTHGNVFEEFHTNNPIDTAEHEFTAFEKQMLALSNILREKGIITTDEVRRKTYENEGVSWHQGSRVVAKAWVDPAYKKRLFEDGVAAAEELGIDMSTANQLIAVENLEDVHHVVVCTLCSCYPRQLLGQPPDWYKSTNYRNRVVVDPRRVLEEMGLELPESTEVRVLDSTAETRYLVVPQRPAGTEGWTEEQLAGLVTRNSMVGVSKALTPQQKKAMAD